MLNWLDRKAIEMNSAFRCDVLPKMQAALSEERGDTNFISILILLAIAIGLAMLFIKFKDQIVGQVESIVNNFKLDG